MKMVPYTKEEVERYKSGERFNVKLRCGSIITAVISGHIIYLGNNNEVSVYFSNGKAFISSTKETFFDIIEIEPKPRTLQVGKTYKSDCGSLYKVLSRDNITGLFIAKEYSRCGVMTDWYYLFNDNGNHTNNCFTLLLETESEYL